MRPWESVRPKTDLKPGADSQDRMDLMKTEFGINSLRKTEAVIGQVKLKLSLAMIRPLADFREDAPEGFVIAATATDDQRCGAGRHDIVSF